VLSLGEQQRLAFARIIFNRPSVVILDESTSALDLLAEEAMYRILNELGVTFISVGHRPSLLQFHDKKLILRGPGDGAILTAIVQTSREGAIMDLTTQSS
jgi:putative ATP-binding cassette transporter